MVALEHKGPCQKMLGKGSRLSMLHVGKAGKKRIDMFPCNGTQGFYQGNYIPLHFWNHTAQVKTLIQRNLVVAAAASVNLLASLPDSVGKGCLNKGMYVLGRIVNGKFSAL